MVSTASNWDDTVRVFELIDTKKCFSFATVFVGGPVQACLRAIRLR